MLEAADRLAALKRAGVVRAARAPVPAGAAFPYGLGCGGVHEVAEGGYGDMAAVTGFALAALASAAPRTVVAIEDVRLAAEHGSLREEAVRQGYGLTASWLYIRTKRDAESLWAVEEALRSAAMSAVVALVPGADFTASRRLALAAAETGTPAILLMPYSREGATAAEARWRITPRPSAPNVFDERAPGNPRWRAVLERSRRVPTLAGQQFDLEFDDETFSFGPVPRVVPRQAAPAAPSDFPGWRQSA